jgi:hypothetical protein
MDKIIYSKPNIFAMSLENNVAETPTNSDASTELKVYQDPKKKRVGRVTKEVQKKEKEATISREPASIKEVNYPKELKTAELVRMNKDVSVNQVFVTNDYTKFKLLQGNRSVDPAHVQELVNSMQEQYLQMPIHVNQDFQVIDGQHRLEACQELGLPIYYMLHDGWALDEVHILNTHQVNWNSIDYLHSFASRGNDQYKIFLKFMEDYGFGYQVSYALLTSTSSAPRGHKTKEFRKGKFEVVDLQRAVKLADIIKTFASFYAGYHTMNKVSYRDNFCLAIIRVANKNMDYVEELLEKFSRTAPMLYHRPLVIDYIKDLEDQYNKGKHSNNSVRWV